MKATFFKLGCGLYINIDQVEVWEEKLRSEKRGDFVICTPYIELCLASGRKLPLQNEDREAWLRVVHPN